MYYERCPPFSFAYRVRKCSFVLPDGTICGKMVKARGLCSQHYKQWQLAQKPTK